MSFVPTTAMRVLFLDIDGVLVRDGTRHFDEEALAQLHRVLARTGAVIVLHSVWKCARPLPSIRPLGSPSRLFFRIIIYFYYPLDVLNQLLGHPLMIVWRVAN